MMRSSDELFYDSDTTLRLVDRAIEELKRSIGEVEEREWVMYGDEASEPGGFVGREAIRQLDARIRDVSVATEAAASDILDSVVHAVSLVEQLSTVDEVERATVLAALDEELGNMTTHLQFQDITTQQLGRIAGALSQMRIAATPRSAPALAPKPLASQALADVLFARAHTRQSA